MNALQPGLMPRARIAVMALLTGLAPSIAHAQIAEPVFTVVTDFDDDSVAASISDVRNVLIADCAAGRVELRQRGPGSMGIEIGATVPGASASCDFLLRVPVRFEQADRVAAFTRVKGAPMRLAFRIRDARGRLFETALQPVNKVHEWQSISIPLAQKDLRPSVEGDKPTWPIEIGGCRVETDEIGRQILYLDDLQVEHRVSRTDTVRGDFNFSEPTRIFNPGQTVRAGLMLENRSRRAAVVLSIELTWLRSDGVRVKTEERSGINFPASRGEFRSRQEIEFSQRLDEPGLYKLVALVRSPGWLAPARFETSIAVTPSNRSLPRGRETFFGVSANLWRESPADQLLEISVARDLGAQLLALDTPWSRIQPAADRYQFETLDRLVEAVNSRDMAVMLSVTDPPAWASSAEDPAQVQAAFMAELAQRYRDRVRHFEAAPEALGQDPAAAVRSIAAAVSAASAEATVLARARRPAASSFEKWVDPAVGGHTGARGIFESGDDLSGGAAALNRFAADRKRAWTDSDWWRFTLPPRFGTGYFSDAEDVLRLCVSAASAGVGGGMWIDLRDDDNDPASPESLRGMVARDFSPKNSLLGFASTVGLLGGLHYVGPVRGAPPEFESAMFIGADRQVAVLLPLPNRVAPALVAPVAGVKGPIAVYDFQRIRQRLIGPAAWPLVATISHPQFIELGLSNAEPVPQLSLRKPWIRLPSRVYLDREAEFTVELAPPIDTRGGYLRLSLPDKSPVQSKFGARQLAASADEEIKQPIKFTAVEGAAWERVVAQLQVSLDGRTPAAEVPIEIRRQYSIRPAPGSAAAADQPALADDHAVVTLAGPEKATAAARVAARYTADQLRLSFTIKDDRFITFKSGRADGATGDEIWVGLAVADAGASLQARLAPISKGATVTPLFGANEANLQQWRVKCDESSAEARVINLTIPAASLGQSRFAPGTRLLLAATYFDDDTAGGARDIHAAGSGLDGRRTSEGYLLLRCGDKP